jgi:hypothetical protein
MDVFDKGNDQEKYRAWREGQGAACASIDLEIGVLSAMYHEARKCKKISGDTVPGQFVIRGDKNPRRIITDAEFEALLEATEGTFRDILICGL